jgi:hypothetical protein
MRGPGSTTIGVTLLLAAVLLSTAWQSDVTVASTENRADSFGLDHEQIAERWSLRLSADHLQLFVLRDTTITHWFETILDTESATSLWARIDSASDAAAAEDSMATPTEALHVIATRDGQDQCFDITIGESAPAALVRLCDELLSEARRLGTVPQHAGRQAWLATPTTATASAVVSQQGPSSPGARRALSNPGWLAPADDVAATLDSRLILQGNRPLSLQRLEVALGHEVAGT